MDEKVTVTNLVPKGLYFINRYLYNMINYLAFNNTSQYKNSPLRTIESVPRTVKSNNVPDLERPQSWFMALLLLS